MFVCVTDNVPIVIIAIFLTSLFVCVSDERDDDLSKVIQSIEHDLASGMRERTTSKKTTSQVRPLYYKSFTAPMAVWSKVLLLTARCLSPLRACPDGRVV